MMSTIAAKVNDNVLSVDIVKDTDRVIVGSLQVIFQLVIL